jgi:hypothetical protein
MRTRTKILVGVGLLAMAGVVMVRRPPAKPVVEVSFVRYGTNGAPVLNLTNRGQGAVRLSALGQRYFSHSESGEVREAGEETWSLWPPIVLVPESGTQLVARPFPASQLPVKGRTVSVQFVAHARVFGWIGVLLSEFGFNANTGFVATVTLPETAASPSPVH